MSAIDWTVVLFSEIAPEVLSILTLLNAPEAVVVPEIVSISNMAEELSEMLIAPDVEFASISLDMILERDILPEVVSMSISVIDIPSTKTSPETEFISRLLRFSESMRGTKISSLFGGIRPILSDTLRFKNSISKVSPDTLIDRRSSSRKLRWADSVISISSPSWGIIVISPETQSISIEVIPAGSLVYVPTTLKEPVRLSTPPIPTLNGMFRSIQAGRIPKTVPVKNQTPRPKNIADIITQQMTVITLIVFNVDSSLCDSCENYTL